MAILIVIVAIVLVGEAVSALARGGPIAVGRDPGSRALGAGGMAGP